MKQRRPHEPEVSPSRRALFLGIAASTAVVTGCEFRRRYPDASPATDAGVDDVALSEDAGDAAADSSAARASDIDDLNALVVAEYGLAAAYAVLAPALQSPATDDPLAGPAPVLLAIAIRWRQQHLDAAAALSDAVTSAGGTATPATGINFTPPPGATLTVENVLKIACNAEKDAAVVHARRVAQLDFAAHRQLAGSIAGAHTQRFTALYALLKGSAQPAAAIATMVEQVVPTSFVLRVGTQPGLESVPDLAFT